MGTRSKAYTIEFNKLRLGPNEFEFELDDKFLSEFEFSPFQKANVKVLLKLFKTENLYDLKFDLKGTVLTVCDTCAEDINLPVQQEFGMLMKLSETNNFDDPEIVYIARTEIAYDLKQFLYESLLLAVPTRKSCEELPEPKKCNPEILERLAKQEQAEDGKEEKGNEKDPRWSKLKDLLN
jgi:uncharacterized metal-binding protein YceD (DUF177 family)